MLTNLKPILFIIVVLFISVITSCVQIPPEPGFGNPVDPDSSYYIGVPSIDLDGDGIGAYRDIDDIFLLFPEDDAVINDDPFDFIVFEFDPTVVERYHIQISRAKHNFERAVKHSNNNIKSNVYTLPEGILTNYETYFWRASAYDGISWSNNWSEIRSFTLALPDYTPLPIIKGSDDIVLAWDPPPEPQVNSEGEPILITSYNVYYRNHGDTVWVWLNNIEAVVNPRYTVNHLGNGEYDFAVSTVGTVGTVELESAFHISIDKDAYPAGGWYLIWEKN